MHVTVGGFHLNHVIPHFQNGDVKGAAAEVIHGDLFVFLFIESVRKRRRGRLVDDALHVEAGDLAGVLGRLALCVVEIRRHRNDRLFNLFSRFRLGILLELLQHHR